MAQKADNPIPMEDVNRVNLLIKALVILGGIVLVFRVLYYFMSPGAGVPWLPKRAYETDTETDELYSGYDDSSDATYTEDEEPRRYKRF